MDPATIAAGAQLLGVFKSNPAPTNVTSGNAPSIITNDFDSSGWTVATGGSTANGSKINKTADSAATSALAGFAGTSPLTIGALLIGAVVLARLLKA